MLLGGIMGLIGTVIDRIIPDKGRAAEAKIELAKLEMDSEMKQMVGQLEINAAEGKHPSMFVAGWRPLIGWICGIAFAYHFIALPIIVLVAASTGHTIDLPTFNMESLMTVLLGMLGLGGLRTYEKYKGVANSFTHKELKLPPPEETDGK